MERSNPHAAALVLGLLKTGAAILDPDRRVLSWTEAFPAMAQIPETWLEKHACWDDIVVALHRRGQLTLDCKSGDEAVWNYARWLRGAVGQVMPLPHQTPRHAGRPVRLGAVRLEDGGLCILAEQDQPAVAQGPVDGACPTCGREWDPAA